MLRQKKKNKSNTKQQQQKNSAQSFQPKNSNVEVKVFPPRRIFSSEFFNEIFPFSQNAVQRLFAAASPSDEFSVWCVKQVKKLNKDIDEKEGKTFSPLTNNSKARNCPFFFTRFV